MSVPVQQVPLAHSESLPAQFWPLASLQSAEATPAPSHAKLPVQLGVVVPCAAVVHVVPPEHVPHGPHACVQHLPSPEQVVLAAQSPEFAHDVLHVVEEAHA